MSHWKKGKLKLKCSLAVLQRALIKIKPEWEKYIKVDPAGGLTVFNSHTGEKTEGAKLVVPGGRRPMGGTIPGVVATPGINYADIGFVQNKEGKWDTLIDPIGYYGADGLEGEITKEVSRMHVKAVARARGFQIAKDEDIERGFRIGLVVPVGEQFRIRS